MADDINTGAECDESMPAVKIEQPDMEVEGAEASPTKGRKRPGRGGPPAKRRKSAPAQPKNALMKLNELKPGLAFENVSQCGPPHDPVFVMAVEVNGQKFFGKGNSKQMAKHAAAKEALASFVQFHNMADAADAMNLPSGNMDFTADADCGGGQNGVSTADVPRISEDRFANKMQKIMSEAAEHQNPVMLLNEVHPGLKYEFVRENERIPSQRFVMQVTVNDQTFEGAGPNKKAAKAAAARSVFSQKFGINFNMLQLGSAGSVPDRELFNFPAVTTDKIGKRVNDTFADIMSNNVEFSKWKVLAGIVMTEDDTMEDITVISVGTGTKHLNGEYMSMNGTAINDCHAEVISRRCLKDFFYSQLELHLEDKGSNSIFVKGPSGKFVVRPNFKFHLFISTSPCGDARIFSVHQNEEAESVDLHPNRRARGLLRTKIESGEGTIPVKEGQGIQTWDGILQGQQRYLTMSCSDKVISWNILGLQGSLLSHFMEPVYLESIVLGRLFHPEHMYRAMCGRIKDVLGELPSPYRLNIPKMSATTSLEARQLAKSPNFSINWTTGIGKPEVIIAKTGKVDNGQVSRLAKRSFFQRFANVYKGLSPHYTGNMESHAYSEMKTAVPEYQLAKEELYKAFKSANLGNWVKKPAEQDEFEIVI